MKYQEIIKSAMDKNPSQVQQNFNRMVGNKIFQGIEARKAQAGANLLRKPVSEKPVSENSIDEAAKSKKDASKKWSMPKPRTGTKPLKKKKRDHGMDDPEDGGSYKKKKVDEAAKTIDLDKIKDKSLNKKAWGLLKKKQKAYYSPSEKDVQSWSSLKNEVDSLNDLFKYTDYVSVTAAGKIV